MPESTPAPRKRQLAETVREHLSERDVKALVRVISAPTPYVGATVLVEAYGLGGLVPNTVVLGDGTTATDPNEYAEMLRRIHDAGRNIVLVRPGDDETFGDRRRIDIWLRSMRDNGALMVALANTLKSSKSWKGATITLRMIVATEEAASGVEANLREMLIRSRLNIAVDVMADTRPAGKVIGGLSGWADLTMVGLPDPCVHPDDFTERYTDLMAGINSDRPVAFVLASADVDLAALLD